MKDSTYKKYCLVIDEWFVNGRNGTKAYQSQYPNSDYKSADSSFRELVEISRVQEYIQEKSELISEKHNITLERQIKELQKILDDKECSNSDKIKVLQEQSKLSALYKDHNNQKNLIVKPSRIEFIDATDG